MRFNFYFVVIFKFACRRDAVSRAPSALCIWLKKSYVYSSEYMMDSWQARPFDRDNPLLLDTCSNYTSMCLYYTSSLFNAPPLYVQYTHHQRCHDGGREQGWGHPPSVFICSNIFFLSDNVLPKIQSFWLKFPDFREIGGNGKLMF